MISPPTHSVDVSRQPVKTISELKPHGGCDDVMFEHPKESFYLFFFFFSSFHLFFPSYTVL